MNNKKGLKLILLVAICICGVCLFFRLRSTNVASDLQMNETKTFTESNTSTNASTTHNGNNTTAVSKSTTQYYDEKGSVKFVLNTKTNFDSVINKKTLSSHCKCTAKYNNQTITNIFRNDTILANEETTNDKIDEYRKNCVDKCIKYGEAHFFGID